MAAAFFAVCQAAIAQTTTGFTSASAGNWGPIVAPDSIAAGFGSNLTSQSFTAFAVPLPTNLGGVGVQVTDSARNSLAAPLYLASQGQVNYLVPAGTAVGLATATVTATGGAKSTGNLLVSNVAPAIFAANGNGSGVAAAQVFFYPASGSPSYMNVFGGAGSAGYNTAPFSISPASTNVYLVLYGTGIRNHSLNPVQATIGGTKVPVVYAGPVAGAPGLDQINVGPLPQSLAGTGKGDVTVALTVDGVPANNVTVNIQ
jgi:uncharacterized protein (TIGR03437 family)